MKIALLGASFNSNNMGVGALTAGAIKAILHQFTDAEIFMLDYGKESMTYNFPFNGHLVPVHLVNMRFSKKLYLKNNVALMILVALLLRTIRSQKLKKKLIKRSSCLSHIIEADILVAISGGDSFSDIYGIGRFLYVCLPQILVLFLGKDLVLLPQTVGPFRSRIARKVAKFIMSKAKVVYSRDYDGIGEMRKMLKLPDKNEKIRFCYDVGFILDPVKPDKVDLKDLTNEMRGNLPLVGFNVSGLLYMGGYSKNNMFELKIDYKKLISDIIDFMIRKKNAEVILVPHVFGTHSESDSVACKELYDVLKDRYKERLTIVMGTYNQNEIKYIIGQCDFFVGSRMHACIAALSQNIPTVSIAYSKKFTGVMNTIGVAELVADPRKLEIEEILEIIDNALEQRGALKKHLEESMPKVKETVLNLFGEIGSLLQGK